MHLHLRTIASHIMLNAPFATVCRVAVRALSVTGPAAVMTHVLPEDPPPDLLINIHLTDKFCFLTDILQTNMQRHGVWSR